MIYGADLVEIVQGLILTLWPIFALFFVSSLVVYFLRYFFNIHEKAVSTILHIGALLLFFVFAKGFVFNNFLKFSHDIFEFSQEILR